MKMGLHTHPTQTQFPSQGTSDQPLMLPKRQHQYQGQQQQQKQRQQRRQQLQQQQSNLKTIGL